jgi:gas vesicle protein
MEAKLTLKLDSDAIKRAKQYISRHKGNSLSKLVEKYFNSLTSEEKEEKRKLPPIVSSLSGALKSYRIKDVKEEYTDYLVEKYK